MASSIKYQKEHTLGEDTNVILTGMMRALTGIVCLPLQYKRGLQTFGFASLFSFLFIYPYLRFGELLPYSWEAPDSG